MKYWNARHHNALLFLIIAASLGGLVLAFSLPVSLFPNINFPRVMVTVDAGEQPIEQMTLQVTTPVEEAVRRVPGVSNIRSTTSRGSTDISVFFNWGTDMPVAALQIDAAISPLLSTLPQGAKIDVKRMDTTVFPIIAYSLTSNHTPLTSVHDIAQYKLLPILISIEGVSQVQVLDNAEEEFRVTVSPEKLRAYGLTLDEVSKALSAANTINALGKTEEHYKLYLVVADTRLSGIPSILGTVIKKNGNGVIRIKDVADVTRESVPNWLKVSADGKEAVLLQVFQQPGSNSVQIAHDVQEALDGYKSKLPKDITLANWYDQSTLVISSADSVRDAIILGIILASFILWLFLRNIRITLVATIMVPAVLAITVIILHILHMSFNIMTLGGMAAAVGLIIDDAIVMVEYIIRKLQAKDESDKPKNIFRAASEFFVPLAGSSAATLIIFIPLAFLNGVTGAFFKALSLTMASALLISFFIAWLIIPLLVQWLIGDRKIEEAPEKYQKLKNSYSNIMSKILSKPYLLAIGIIPFIIIGSIAYLEVGTGFMPSIDEGGFVLDYRSQPGTSTTETDRLLKQVEKIIKTTPEVENYSRRTGAGLGGSINEANEGDFFIRLKPLPRRSLDKVMNEIRDKVETNVPGLEVELAKLMEDFIGDLTSVPEPVEIKIYADNPDLIVNFAGKISGAIKDVNGLVDIKNGIKPAGDALEIYIDPDRAALEGSDVASISQILQTHLSGNIATQIILPNKLEAVRVWVPAESRSSLKTIKQILVKAPDGHLFPLSRVADIKIATGQPQVTREDLKRMVAVTGRVSGRDVGAVVADIKTILDKPGLIPKEVSYQLGGLYKEQQDASNQLIIIFAAAISLIFLLLLFLYESFSVAFAILVMPILSLSSIFFGLWISGIDLNISAMVGMTMIIGIITEVSIFYFSEYFRLINEINHKNALIQAALNRARPIIMTTLTAILTLLPLAFALGQGAAMQQPLAIAIIFGLLVQVPLVLIVMPILFNLIKRK